MPQRVLLGICGKGRSPSQPETSATTSVVELQNLPAALPMAIDMQAAGCMASVEAWAVLRQALSPFPSVTATTAGLEVGRNCIILDGPHNPNRRKVAAVTLEAALFAMAPAGYSILSGEALCIIATSGLGTIKA